MVVKKSIDLMEIMVLLILIMLYTNHEYKKMKCKIGLRSILANSIHPLKVVTCQLDIIWLFGYWTVTRKDIFI